MRMEAFVAPQRGLARALCTHRLRWWGSSGCRPAPGSHHPSPAPPPRTPCPGGVHGWGCRSLPAGSTGTGRSRPQQVTQMRCMQATSSYLACLFFWLCSSPKPWVICPSPAPPATTAASHGPWAPHPTSATPSLPVQCNGMQLTPAAPSSLPGSSIPSQSLQACPKPQTAWPTPLSPLDAPSPPPNPPTTTITPHPTCFLPIMPSSAPRSLSSCTMLASTSASRHSSVWAAWATAVSHTQSYACTQGVPHTLVRAGRWGSGTRTPHICSHIEM